MKKVYQTIVDKGNGNCMQASMASLFDLELEEVPHFLELQNKTGVVSWTHVKEWLKDRGYEITDWLYPENILNQSTKYAIQVLLRYVPSINGHFYASVRSKTYYDIDGTCHAVILNEYGETAHDPNPNYELEDYHPIIMIPVIEKIKEQL